MTQIIYSESFAFSANRLI